MVDVVGKCIVCGFFGKESEHRCTVPDIPKGYSFIANEQRYFADKPSISVSEIKTIVGHGFMYQTIQEIDGDKVQLDDHNAVDLRTCPKLYFIPPATY